MAWETDLQDASFRGVAFDIITTRDSVQRDIAQHEYPYRNGANIDDPAVNHAACSVRRSSLATTMKAGCRRSLPHWTCAARASLFILCLAPCRICCAMSIR